MPLTTRERTELREELVGQGYSWEYIDEWQAKTSLWRHRAQVSPSGEVVSEVGTKLDNLPGDPAYVNSKARQGLLRWPPGDSCSCRWCAQRKGESPTQEATAPDTEAPERPTRSRRRRRLLRS